MSVGQYVLDMLRQIEYGMEGSHKGESYSVLCCLLLTWRLLQGRALKKLSNGICPTSMVYHAYETGVVMLLGRGYMRARTGSS